MNKGMLFMVAAVAATMVSVSAKAQNCCDGTKLRTVQVTGYAEKEIEPDQIFMSITIDENDQKTAKSKLGLEQWEKVLVKALKTAGIDTETKLTVDDMNSNFRDFVLRKSEARTSKKYQLEVNNAAQMAAVVAALEEAGISNIDLVRVSHTQIDKLKGELRTAAILNAKAAADQLAEALGDKIYRVSDINDYSRVNNYAAGEDTMIVTMSKRSSFNSEAPKIEFKKIKLTHTLSATFELK